MDAYVLVSVTEIGDSAFDDCSVQLYLYVEELSYAEIYARLYNLAFTYGNEDNFLKDTDKGQQAEEET